MSTITFPAVDLSANIGALLSWGLPIIASLFVVKFGIGLVFGKKR
jgi:hypothetical protein